MAEQKSKEQTASRDLTELISRYRAGEPADMEALYLACRRELYERIRQIVKSHQDTEDLLRQTARATAGGREVTADTVARAHVNISRYDETRGWTGDELTLTPEQALDLYRTGILPDAKAGNIGRWFSYEGGENLALSSTVGVTLELTPKAQTGSEANYYWDSVIDLNVLMCSENTRRWLKENLDLEPENQAALQQAGEPRLAK